ncbi:hypothetical protein POV26_11285 [Aequorivita todarodis]|uniref:hypothetical protein n=1 Tax=Aequorivita todarodis TaxID=2036821 RepID=UPI0023505018|nr:hypothetical protein [Aequorivita todarodis]MDC8001623.1 hypothetical protein [Aequorivita todarodis]
MRDLFGESDFYVIPDEYSLKLTNNEFYASNTSDSINIDLGKIKLNSGEIREIIIQVNTLRFHETYIINEKVLRSELSKNKKGN